MFVAPIKVGELLTRAGLLAEQDLREALQVAAETGLPIGRVLTMSDYLTEDKVQAAVQIQSLIKENALSTETALQALRMVSELNMTLDQSLAKCGWKPKKAPFTNKLGQLLLDAQLVNEDQLTDALKRSGELGLPVGRILVLTSALSDELLTAALNAQVMLRDGKITREQAVQGLKSAKMRHVSLEQCLLDQGHYRLPPRRHVKLGELLILSGTLTESDLVNALELGLVNEQPLGHVLVHSGFITNQLLDQALKLQEMVASGSLNPMQAAEALASCRTKSISIKHAVAELGLLKQEAQQTIRLGELLKLCGFINQEDITQAIDLACKNSALMGKMLMVTGSIDEPVLHAALRCQYLLREGFLKTEQAVIALNYCQRTQVSFDDALRELGWGTSSRGEADKREDSTIAQPSAGRGQ